jgi:hypothetical protein
MTNRLQATGVALAVAAMAGGLGGCAQTSQLLSFLHIGGGAAREKSKLAVRAIETPVELAQTSAQDRLYDQAKTAIEKRDYASALDLLQLAKQRDPNDGRVLNAMGVVYDKLGRFDLSKRYYQLALAAQPNSPAVMANMQYSSQLQAYSTLLQDQPAAQTVVAQAPVRAVTQVPAPTPAFQLAVAPSTAIRVVEPTTLGSPIMLVDASGAAHLAGGVQRHLAAHGWSVEATERRASSATTTIVYKVQHRRVAEALAKTLPFATKLQACDGGCTGIRLVIGANARLQGRG